MKSYEIDWANSDSDTLWVDLTPGYGAVQIERKDDNVEITVHPYGNRANAPVAQLVVPITTLMVAAQLDNDEDEENDEEGV